MINERGQALVTLLFFVIIAITITSAAVTLLPLNTRGTSMQQDGFEAYYIAESGVENALLRILRDPTYTGEDMQIGGGTASIHVTPGSPTTILSSGVIGNHLRRIKVVVNFASGIYTINSWKETY